VVVMNDSFLAHCFLTAPLLSTCVLELSGVFCRLWHFPVLETSDATYSLLEFLLLLKLDAGLHMLLPRALVFVVTPILVISS
jgi:hypothetical protein